jgi:hypothetical protein
VCIIEDPLTNRGFKWHPHSGARGQRTVSNRLFMVTIGALCLGLLGSALYPQRAPLHTQYLRTGIDRGGYRCSARSGRRNNPAFGQLFEEAKKPILIP